MQTTQTKTPKQLVVVPFGVEIWSLYAMSLFEAPPPRTLPPPKRRSH